MFTPHRSPAAGTLAGLNLASAPAAAWRELFGWRSSARQGDAGLGDPSPQEGWRRAPNAPATFSMPNPPPPPGG